MLLKWTRYRKPRGLAGSFLAEEKDAEEFLTTQSRGTPGLNARLTTTQRCKISKRREPIANQKTHAAKGGRFWSPVLDRFAPDDRGPLMKALLRKGSRKGAPTATLALAAPDLLIKRLGVLEVLPLPALMCTCGSRCDFPSTSRSFLNYSQYPTAMLAAGRPLPGCHYGLNYFKSYRRHQGVGRCSLPAYEAADHIVRRQRPPDPLQLELTDWLDLHGVLDLVSTEG